MTNPFFLIFLLGIIAVFHMAENDMQQNFFVSSFSPPDCHQKLIVSVECGHGPPNINDRILSYGYNVVDRCSMKTILGKNDAEQDNLDRNHFSINDKEDVENGLNIIDVLLKWNPNRRFLSRSSTKRSLELGKVLLFNDTSPSATTVSDDDSIRCVTTMSTEDGTNIKEIHVPLMELQSHIGSINSVLQSRTIFVLVEPIAHPEGYPISVTKYMFPPIPTVGLVPIVYEDNHLAVVNKPENMTTIGSTSSSGSERANDLQSVLGFLLRPSPYDPSYHPRPIHRLDRRTSGLVLVAKTKDTMRTLSKAFATRTVTKTYSALVFECDHELSGQLDPDNNKISSPSTNEWLIVDYPIEKREAISEVRRVNSLTTSHGSDDSNETFSLVEVRPKTGRTHQIRRHLSYCLGMPIVGDSKYDKGARHLRTNGMYLCCHSLKFLHMYTNKGNLDDVYMSQDATFQWTYPNSHEVDPIRDPSQRSGSQLSIRIPLPDKFLSWID